MTGVSRPPGPGRRGAALAALLIVSGVGIFAVPAQAAAFRAPASQPLVLLLHDQVARTGPSGHLSLIHI